MTLTPGTRLGIYEIVGPLGAGAMGEVYRARDMKLQREVALKVVPAIFAGDSDRLARFEREARTVAALNHPCIAQVYGFEDSAGIQAIAMELVEGPTLADRLAGGPLPAAEALGIARQIAEALEVAHDHGIIHRDLKPANIKIKDDGTVKVLDFGLAKALDPAHPVRQGFTGSEPLGASASPTMTSPATELGVLLGTAAYMAPEQAQGRPVDKRADIWAFGCVLYEMLAGGRAFGGNTVAETLAAVLRDEVDWNALPLSTPPTVRRILARCLERNPKERFHDIADVRIALNDLSEPPSSVASPKAASLVRATGLFLAGAIVAGGAFWFGGRGQAPLARPVQRFALAGLGSLVVDPNQALTLSPDGRVLAFRGRSSDGVDRLFVRPFDSLLAAPMSGTEGGRQPFFSPDGRWLGFFADGSLKKVALAGGAPQMIAPANAPLGGSWMDDGSIVFVPDVSSGLLRVPSAGGTPETLIPVDSQNPENTFATPWALPGGRGVLLTIRQVNRFDLAVLSLPDRKLQVLAEDAYAPILSSTGHVLFHQGNSILALPFDSERLAVTGPAFPVLSNLATRISFQTRLFTVSGDGTLVYVPAPGSEGAWRMVRVDRRGETSVLTTFDRAADTPRLSPDGSRVAFRTPAPNCDVWVHDLTRGTTTRLTHEGDNHGVVWIEDGARIATARERGETIDIIAISTDGSGSIERIGAFPVTSGALPSSWAPGALLVQSAGGRTGHDISMLGAGDAPKPIVNSPFEESGAVVSRDGRYIAFLSNESGRAEVYLQPLGSPGPRVQVSTAGGVEPVWAPSGKELFFRRGRDLFAVSIESAPRFSMGRPQLLFSGEYAFGALAATVAGLPNYDVAPDGKHFVMMTGTQWLEGQLVVVLNWFDDWKRLGSGGRP